MDSRGELRKDQRVSLGSRRNDWIDVKFIECDFKSKVDSWLGACDSSLSCGMRSCREDLCTRHLAEKQRGTDPRTTDPPPTQQRQKFNLPKPNRTMRPSSRVQRRL